MIKQNSLQLLLFSALLLPEIILAASNPLQSSPIAPTVQPPSFKVSIGGQYQDGSNHGFIQGLFSFIQQEQQLLFFQGGWYRQSQNNLFSVGIGQRCCLEEPYGCGYNLFYNQDTSQHRRRWGLGVEAWLRSLNVSANAYLPIEGWHTAQKIKNYRSRTAHGFDIALQGYLPALPHLGASVKYAQFFGNEVAWNSDPKLRKKDPKHWSLGIDYTPIPLLTMGYRCHWSQQHSSNHQVGFTLSYQFNTPLARQLDTTQVATLHSPQGRQLQLVNREQLMVLRYAQVALPPAPPLRNAQPGGRDGQAGSNRSRAPGDATSLNVSSHHSNHSIGSVNSTIHHTDSQFSAPPGNRNQAAGSQAGSNRSRSLSDSSGYSRLSADSSITRANEQFPASPGNGNQAGSNRSRAPSNAT